MSHTNLKAENPSRYNTKHHNDENRQQHSYTASALYSGFSDLSSQPTCTFCKKNHSSAKCTIITDPASRKAILRTKAKCFICFRSGHKASECKSKNRCFKCNSRHHISNCNDKNYQTTSQTTPSSLNSPNINVIVTPVNGQKVTNGNSQTNIQNNDVVNRMNLENSHSTMLSLNKDGSVLLQTGRGMIINCENKNLNKNVRIYLIRDHKSRL